MKNILILGASKLQLPAIIQAKDMGLYVIVADQDDKAIGVEFCDLFMNISTTDTEKLLQVAIENHIDAIFTMATDMPMRTVSYIGEYLKLNTISYETSLNATDKFRMRNILHDANIPIPFYKIINSIDELLFFNLNHHGEYILKPIDSSGSRGVTSLRLPLPDIDIINFYNYSSKYSKTGKILIEELMIGPEISVESITYEGKTNIVAVTDKITTGKPNFVEIGHNIPSIYSKDLVKEIVNKTINALGIRNSATHTEIIITSEGPKIVEIGSRLGGDYITSHLVPLATGYNIVEAAIYISLGIKPKNLIDNKHSSAIRFITGVPGIIKKFEFLSDNPDIKEIFFSKKIGDKIDISHNSAERIGHIICQSKNSIAGLICDNEFKKINLLVDKNG